MRAHVDRGAGGSTRMALALCKYEWRGRLCTQQLSVLLKEYIAPLWLVV